MASIESCPCCLDPIDLSKTSLSLIACKHSFHASCINKWFDQAKNTCPMCRTLIAPMQMQMQKVQPIMTSAEIASYDFGDLIVVQGIHKEWTFHSIEYAMEMYRIMRSNFRRDDLVNMCEEAAKNGLNLIRIRTRLDLGNGYIYMFTDHASFEDDFVDLGDKLQPFATAFQLVTAVKAVHAFYGHAIAPPRSAYTAYLSRMVRETDNKWTRGDRMAIIDSSICMDIISKINRGIRLDQILHGF
jgi:hypothetical protein